MEKKYVTKPREVYAIQYKGRDPKEDSIGNIRACVAFCEGRMYLTNYDAGARYMLRMGHSKDIPIHKGNYIVKDENGFSVISEDEFNMLYELAPEHIEAVKPYTINSVSDKHLDERVARLERIVDVVEDIINKKLLRDEEL